jgi:putative SOS response-associated peptidase YedK
MCNEYARENEVEQAIRYMEEMKYTPPISWTDGQIPNDTAPKKSIKIRDKGIIARMQGARAVIEALTWAWTTPQGKPVFNFVSEGRDFSKSDRALVMATGFYEYTKPEDPKVKLKDQHFFTMNGGDWFWIAGIVRTDASQC